MSPATRIMSWATTAAVASTGCAYAVMAYCMSPADPMDVVNHPWQPEVQHWHVLTAPLWLFAFGVLWQNHVWPKLRLRSRPRRRSGIVLLLLAIPMALSGYLLQTAEAENWRRVWVVVHMAASLLWLAALGGHVILRRQ